VGRTCAALWFLLLCTACGGSGSQALFDLQGKGTLIVGHYSFPPVYRHLDLRWNDVCSGPGSGQGFGIRIDGYRGDPATYPVRSVFSAASVLPGSVGKASASGQSRITIHRAGYVVVSASAPMGGTTYYDLNTRCRLQITATGERR
jgi:hypothetical protein